MPSASVMATEAEKALCVHRFRNVCRRCSSDIRIMLNKLLIPMNYRRMVYRSMGSRMRVPENSCLPDCPLNNTHTKSKPLEGIVEAGDHTAKTPADRPTASICRRCPNFHIRRRPIIYTYTKSSSRCVASSEMSRHIYHLVNMGAFHCPVSYPLDKFPMFADNFYGRIKSEH